MLAKAIETLPALALSEVVLYFSAPSGLASRLRLLLVVGAGVEDVVGLVSVAVVAAAAGAEAAEELLELELPQPASTSSPAARARNETTGLERNLAAPAL
jgi:hypothetical protein